MLMYFGSNSFNVSIESYSFSMPVPFIGGKISKEKAVLLLFFIKSITFIGYIYTAAFLLPDRLIDAKITKKSEFCTIFG